MSLICGKNWPTVKKAWEFERTHDTDGDGIYDNSQGTGWVENWDPYKMPHQEIYLAALDQQASGAMGRLSAKMGDDAGAQAARREQQPSLRRSKRSTAPEHVRLQLQRHGRPRQDSDDLSLPSPGGTATMR
jgi:uncharacterized protein (DUF608 family)